MEQEIRDLICHECQEHYWGQMDYCPHIGVGCDMLNASVEAVVQWTKKDTRDLREDLQCALREAGRG